MSEMALKGIAAAYWKLGSFPEQPAKLYRWLPGDGRELVAEFPVTLDTEVVPNAANLRPGLYVAEAGYRAGLNPKGEVRPTSRWYIVTHRYSIVAVSSEALGSLQRMIDGYATTEPPGAVA